MADHGGLAAYLKVPFAEGGVTAKGYEGWIGLNSFSFTVKRKTSVEKGSENSQDKDNVVAQLSEFNVGKMLDSASGDLLFSATATDSGGEQTNRFEIVLCSVDVGSDGRPKMFTKFVLHGAVIQSLDASGSSYKIAESLVIVFDHMEAEFHPHNESLAGKSIIRFEHDMHKKTKK